MTMTAEIAEQPEVIARLLDTNRPLLGQLGRLISGCSHVVIAARGTSDNAARYAQYVWGARNRLSVGLAGPSLFGPLDSPPDLDGALVVGISQSGESPDLVAVLEEGRQQGRPTLAITNHPDSPMAETADAVIELCAGPERAVAATKTYSSQLAAVALASCAFAGADTDPLSTLPEEVDRALTMPNAIPARAAELAGANRCVVIGRGFHQATVFEWALKMQELTYVLAQPFSAADFLHGPVAVVDSDVPVLAVVTAGPTYDMMTAVVERVSGDGAPVLTMTDVATAPGDHRIAIPAIDPWLSPIVAAPALQLFAHDLAVARHLDPDSPRGLSKVTRTR